MPLPIAPDSLYKRGLLLERGRICMISAFSQIARPRPMSMLDAVCGH
jgi:hypothetical protein